MEIRLWIPFNLSGWKYCLKHPKSFVIGIYSYKRFLEQRNLILAQRKQIEELKDKVSFLTTKTKDLGIELSKQKRR